MSNVREVNFERTAPNEDVVQMLEEWLTRAKDGTMQAIGIVGAKSNGEISTEWRGLGKGYLHQINSAAAILQHRILQANIEPD